jgi:hypothetical protein
VGSLQKDQYVNCVKNGLKAVADQWPCLVDTAAIRAIVKRMDVYEDSSTQGAMLIHKHYVTPLITDMFRRAKLPISRTHRDSRASRPTLHSMACLEEN